MQTVNFQSSVWFPRHFLAAERKQKSCLWGSHVLSVCSEDLNKNQKGLSSAAQELKSRVLLAEEAVVVFWLWKMLLLVTFGKIYKLQCTSLTWRCCFYKKIFVESSLGNSNHKGRKTTKWKLLNISYKRQWDQIETFAGNIRSVSWEF